VKPEARKLHIASDPRAVEKIELSHQFPCHVRPEGLAQAFDE
jgi:hypothetical protein